MDIEEFIQTTLAQNIDGVKKAQDDGVKKAQDVTRYRHGKSSCNVPCDYQKEHIAARLIEA